jgi:hypothetical protein
MDAIGSLRNELFTSSHFFADGGSHLKKFNANAGYPNL